MTTTRGRGAVRQWTKSCSDYDGMGNATEVLYQTVYQGKVFEIRATPDEVVFFQSPRQQVRAPAAGVLDAIGHGATLEEAFDFHILEAEKPESIERFLALTAAFESRPQRQTAAEPGRNEGD